MAPLLQMSCTLDALRGAYIDLPLGKKTRHERMCAMMVC
jgi:hypothetical protein